MSVLSLIRPIAVVLFQMHSTQSLFLALGPLLSLVSARNFYAQSDIYQGDTFFDKFDFFTDVDPTGGYVEYVAHAPLNASLIFYLATSLVPMPNRWA